MIIGFCGLVENGKDGVYGLGQSLGRIRVIEEGIGPRVIEIEAGEAKLWSWETWLGMWTTIRFPIGGLVGTAPNEGSELLWSAYSSPLSFLCSSPLTG